MALHLALQDAPTNRELGVAGDDHDTLPERPGDYDWDGCLEMLFQDHDILWLFDPGYDGVEDPGTDLNRKFRVGDLRPQAWFETFGNSEPRDPGHGLDR